MRKISFILLLSFSIISSNNLCGMRSRSNSDPYKRRLSGNFLLSFERIVEEELSKILKEADRFTDLCIIREEILYLIKKESSLLLELFDIDQTLILSSYSWLACTKHIRDFYADQEKEALKIISQMIQTKRGELVHKNVPKLLWKAQEDHAVVGLTTAKHNKFYKSLNTHEVKTRVLRELNINFNKENWATNPFYPEATSNPVFVDEDKEIAFYQGVFFCGNITNEVNLISKKGLSSEVTRKAKETVEVKFTLFDGGKQDGPSVERKCTESVVETITLGKKGTAFYLLIRKLNVESRIFKNQKIILLFFDDKISNIRDLMKAVVLLNHEEFDIKLYPVHYTEFTDEKESDPERWGKHDLDYAVKQKYLTEQWEEPIPRSCNVCKARKCGCLQ